MEAAKPHKGAAGAIAGYLVLQNGRQAGTRRPLGTPTTFIGRSDGCDIRLNVDGVAPLHCLLVFGPSGIQVRDLNSTHGTFVNGVRTELLLLTHGDTLTVGPFQFRLELNAASIPAEPAATPSDTFPEAARIQAAAIAAQQIALEEEESRLQKRKSDLEQQEEQLAAHLAAKQRQLEEWSESAKADRESLNQDKIEHERNAARIEAELLRAREELGRDHQTLTMERQHISKVHQRLRERWQKHWAAEKEKYRHLASQLDADRKLVDQQHAAARDRELKWKQENVHFLAEREMCMRQLQDERDDLRKDRDAWRKRRSLELTVIQARRRELDENQIKIAQARQRLVEEKNAWERRQQELQNELLGLNNRVLHQRMRMQEQAEEIARLELKRPRGTTESEPIECDVEVLPDEPTQAASILGRQPDRSADLDRLAEDLADQRGVLIEQFHRLAEIQHDWHQERDLAAADLEVLAERLIADEKALSTRQQQTTVVEDLLRARQAEIDAVRQEIVIWRAQLKSREQVFEEEHAKEMRLVCQKEELLDEQLTGLAQLRERWNQRRHEELERLQADRASLARQQKEMHNERVELFAKAEALAEEKRVVAENSLAVEQYRQEVLMRVNDPAAQQRIERLCRGWHSLNADLVRHAKGEQDAAKSAFARLDECRTELQDRLSRLTQDESGLAQKQTLLDEREAAVKARQLFVEQELRKLEEKRQLPERESVRMMNQIEILAHAVLDDADPTPRDKAA